MRKIIVLFAVPVTALLIAFPQLPARSRVTVEKPLNGHLVVRTPRPPVIRTPRPPHIPASLPAAARIKLVPPTTPAPAPQARTEDLSVQQRLINAWPGDDQKMLSVVKCESGFNPTARSKPTKRNPEGKYWGLFQADSDFRATYGWAGWGVEEQAAMAWRGYTARGWQPWSCA